ncbi:PEBP-like protein [Amniculicola lignicola CBS 123094]|uniref:PEBP-like protein n=1 Tax=Amniculicola lignicola CBS 123094 TaxID=1392246 RepID=A0A6A5W5A8_9PLEO|nr:PEBP-like protein [Amniculicola lignicola CBS 123094]
MTLITESLLHSLKAASLLPSAIIPAEFNPSIDLSVEYPDKPITHGNLMRVSDVKETPKISFTGAPDQSYTFMLIDPDAPTPDDPKFAYWRHWVVTNIKGEGNADVAQAGTTLTQYLAPGVKDESRPHRYMFLLFQEPADLKLSKEDVGGEEFVDRRSFKVDEWVKKHGLEIVAVNWMTGAGDGWKES